MKPATIGLRMHSGWGVLVVISGEAHSVELVDRRRIVTSDPRIPGANQPYHHAARLAFPEAEEYLVKCAAVSERLALTAIGEVLRELRGRHYRVVGSAVLMASGRPLPPLPHILGSHPLRHTAEGISFRQAVTKACERLNIAVTPMRERELDELAKAAFGKAASRVQRAISSLGRSLGPPWTKDHKNAALAAVMILAPAETVA